MSSKGQAMQTRIEEYNESAIAQRQELPNLVEMIKEFQNGNQEMFDDYFYGYKEIDRVYNNGKYQAYEVSRVRFWDQPLSIFLTNIKKRYCREISVGEQSGFGDRKITYKANISNFEESEIDAEWYQWMQQFSLDVKVENFKKETEAKTLNALRLYIRKSFESHLKKINNQRIGLERVRVGGELYYVKNKQEEVFFEDIYAGSDDEGNKVDFLNTIGCEDTYEVEESNEMKAFTSKEFIEDNLESVLTKKQYEKYMMLLTHIEKYGIETILDKHSGNIIKARVQRVIYPDKEYKNIERVDSLIKIMNKRMEKALVKIDLHKECEEIEDVEEKIATGEASRVVTYTGGLTQEEVDRYFEIHLDNIFKAHTEKRLSFSKGSEGMLPSLDSLNELPFDVYESFIKGGKSVKMSIIRDYYNTDKFKLQAGEKKVVDNYVEKKPENKNDRYITVDQLRDIRRDAGK